MTNEEESREKSKEKSEEKNKSAKLSRILTNRRNGYFIKKSTNSDKKEKVCEFK